MPAWRASGGRGAHVCAACGTSVANRRAVQRKVAAHESTKQLRRRPSADTGSRWSAHCGGAAAGTPLRGGHHTSGGVMYKVVSFGKSFRRNEEGQDLLE